MNTSIPLLFKYHNENNGYLYLNKFIYQYLKLNYNEFKIFNQQIFFKSKKDKNINILNYENYFIIDFKKIKLNENEFLFTIINYLLIKNKDNSYKFTKFDINYFLFINLTSINENYISKLSNIIEFNQQFNKFIFFSSINKLNSNIFNKIRVLSANMFLNPITEFTIKYKSNNEKQIFKLLHNDFMKTELLLELLKKKENIKSFANLKPVEIYSLVCKYIKIYEIIDNYLLTDKIYDIAFSLITMYNVSYIIKSILELIKFVSFNNITNNKLYLKNIENLLINIENYEEGDVISLKKYINEIKKNYIAGTK